MQKIPGCILKADKIELEGQVQLGEKQTPSNVTTEKDAVLSTPVAHIVESHSQFAVIQVTCSCGKQIYLKCEYNTEPSTGGFSETKGDNRSP